VNSNYTCPWCEFGTDSAKLLIQHLALAPASHAVLASELDLVKREIAERWEN
jgi:hypothetical protein